MFKPKLKGTMVRGTIAAVGLALAGALAAAPATAGPATINVTPAVQTGDTSGNLITPVKRWHRDDWHNDRYRGRHYDRYSNYRYDRYSNFRYDRRYYDRPPPGWRRYSYAPYGWRDRGCISVGPVWYCS